MSTHDEYMTRRQARDLARRLARLERKTRSTAAAHADLRHSSVDGGVFKIKDADGNTAYELGTDPTTGVTALQFKGGPTPEQPSEPFVDVGGEVVKIQHSGLDVEENPAPADFQRAQIHVAQDEVFEPSLSTLAGYLEEADGSFTHRLPGGEWYVGVVWETLSGKTSVMSDTVLADIPPLVDTGDLEDTLAAAEEKLNTYRDEVAAPRFEALETGLETNTTNLADARNRLSAAEQTLSPLPGRIESAEQDVAAAQVEATKAAAAAVEANNRAMTRLANGNFESDLLYWDHDNVELTSTAHSGQQAAQVSGWLRPGSSFPVVPGQIWELSLYHQHDVSVEFQAIVGDTRTVLSTHHLDGDSTWSDSGALRVTIPADVHMLSFTITGTSTIVDDITLRDVTDVVRLEEAANANRQKAEQAISELAVLQLAVDGEGGLKDRLQSAETVLETKADTSALDQLDQKLRTDLAAFEAHYTRVWRQPTPPPPGVHYEWLGEPHASASVRLDGDGNETARNLTPYPNPRNTTTGWTTAALSTVTPSDHGLQVDVIATHAPGSNLIYESAHRPITPGEVRSAGFVVEVPSGYPSVGLFGVIYEYGGNSVISSGETVTIEPGETKRLTVTPNAVSPSNNVRLLIRAGTRNAVGSRFYVREVITQNTGEVSTYFDGDTPSDRAHDLWYNAEGVPHEWVNGQGWTPISDARITELASQVDTLGDRLNTAETGLEEALEGPIDHDRLRVGTGAFDEAFASKLIADHATIINAAMRNLSVEEKLLFAEAIGEQIWAELGVFDRLQAREGWIGGTLLADGSVTAEKIHATRELITKIMGAEWAYIAQQLIVDGSILTRDLEALSAAIQSLTVTQRADIAQLWAEELWTALAVIEELQAEEAWITSAMISELTAEKVTVTQEFVARIGAFAEILGDKLWANEAFIDRMAASEAYFGSEDADQQTRVNGQGVTLYRLIDGELIPAAQFGGGLTQLAFFDGNDSVGSIDQHGNAAFQQLAANHLTVAGREVFPPNPAPEYEGYLFDALPRGIRDKAVADMAGVSEPREAYGFLEVSARVEAGREYRVRNNAFRMSSGTFYYASYRYTFSDTGTPPAAPHTESTSLTRWSMQRGDTGTEGTPGEHIFTATQTGIMRILLAVHVESGTGITFHPSSFYTTVTLTLEDIGPARQYTGMRRYAAHGGGTPVNRDNAPLLQGRTTAWTPTWQQTYRGDSGLAPRFSRPANTPAIQGRSSRTGGDWYATMLGGYTTTPGQGDDHGQTMQAALAGAHQVAGRLLFTGVAQEFAQSGPTVWYWHSEGSAPQALPIGSPLTAFPGNGYVGEQHTFAGSGHSITIPDGMIQAIRDNTFRGITMHPVQPGGYRHLTPYHGVQGVLGNKPPTIELTIQR